MSDYIKAVYYTDEASFARLQKKLDPLGVHMTLNKTGENVTLRIDMDDLRFYKTTNRRAGRKVKEPENGMLTIGAVYTYLKDHTIRELAEMTGLSTRTCDRRIARYKKEGRWNAEEDLLYF